MTKHLYPVMEIFNSIQGEGAMIGMPVTFIRFAGCNLKCPWCDTKESWQKPNIQDLIDLQDKSLPETFSEVDLAIPLLHYEEQIKSLGYAWMTIDDMLTRCTQDIVVLTGGEPLIQNLEPLLESLNAENKFICVETNCTQTIPDGIAWVVGSPKPPKYAIAEGNIEKINELKYVVDNNFTVEVIPAELKEEVTGQVWLQPLDAGEDKEASKRSVQRAFELVMQHPYLRLGIQMHKVVGIK